MRNANVYGTLKRRRGWTFFLLALLLFLFALPAFVYFSWPDTLWRGQSKNGRIHIGNFNDELITRTGIYPLPPERKLQTRIVETSLVDVSIIKDNMVVLDSSNQLRFSDAMRWAVLWESEKSRLWIFSSDVGTHVYQKQESGQSEMSWVADSKTLVKEMPEDIFNYHTERSKKEWAQYRAK